MVHHGGLSVHVNSFPKPNLGQLQFKLLQSWTESSDKAFYLQSALCSFSLDRGKAENLKGLRPAMTDLLQVPLLAITMGSPDGDLPLPTMHIP